MSFVVYTPDRTVRKTVRLGKAGKATFPLADLAEIGVTTHAIILTDRDLKRIAIRAPRTGEKGQKVYPGTQSRNTARMSLGGAITSLGLKRGTVAGRIPTTRKDDMLIVNLTPQ